MTASTAQPRRPTTRSMAREGQAPIASSAQTGQSPLTVAELAAEHLRAADIDQPRLEAELLLSAVLGLRRLDLYLRHDRPLTPGEAVAYRAAVDRRLRHEPLQYIAGEAQFRELMLRVDPRVLIPRPETEVLVEEVLTWAVKDTTAMSAARAGSSAPFHGAPIGALSNRTGSASEDRHDHPFPPAPERALALPVDRMLEPRKGRVALADRAAPGLEKRTAQPRTLTALDIGTGSGAIALSLAHEGPFARVVGTDISGDALTVAADNAQRLGVAERIELRRGSLFEAIRADERFDVIVSNPPYVGDDERAALAPEVRDWEPPLALFASGGGLDLLRALVQGAPAHLRPNGLLALEVGLGQARTVACAAEAAGAYASVRIAGDLTGRDRIVLGVARHLQD